MTSWTPDLRHASSALYLEIAAALGRDIDAGVLAPGTRLPTHRELARALRVNVGTITRAYAEAARRGWIEGEVGRGSFVRHPAARSLLSGVRAPIPGDIVDLALNLPCGGPSSAERRKALHALAESTELDECFFGYHLGGLERHRRAGSHWLEQSGVKIPAERLLVSGGSQHALALALATISSPGEVLLCEALTYAGLKSIADVLGLRLQPLAFDEGGVLPDALESALAHGTARALYCQPTAQNPTGATLSLERRRALVSIARRHGLTILEDDTYGFLREGSEVPLAELAPELTWLITGMSKSLSSGLRTGFLAVPTQPAGCMERVHSAVSALGWTSAPLGAELVAHWIENGVAARVAAEKRKEAAERTRLAVAMLAPHAAISRQTSSHLWLSLPEPWRASDFVARARQAGVAVSASEAFAVGRANAPHAVRLSISTPPTRNELERGLGALLSVLSSTPTSTATLV